MPFSVSLPKHDQRLAICGSTGSGKTIAGLWQLAEADIDLRPWFIWDFKRDKNIAKLAAKELPLTIGRLPREPGLYVFRPIPEQDDAQVKRILWMIWEMENAGNYIDEGYMIGRNNSAFNALLTQGRSKHIQMITLSQRPAWMSRFVFSEADYFQVFRLNDKRDYETVQAMCGIDITSRLPSYYSHWYEVEADAGAVLKPVPKPADIIATINGRLKRRIGMI
jgi:hypothetical protein